MRFCYSSDFQFPPMKCVLEENSCAAPNAFLTDAQVQRYLAVLGTTAAECSLPALHGLVTAHLRRIPFENISMLYRLSRLGLAGIPSLELFLDGIENDHFGGMCHSSNIHFHRLLTALGYNTKLCGADMSVPNAHMVIVVTLDGHEYLVDVGYGAPFSSPMRRDLNSDFIIELDHASYRLKPQDAGGRSRMEFHQGGVLKGFYIVKPEPKQIEEFQTAIADLFQPTAVFRTMLLLARFWPERFRVIHNYTVLDSSPDHFAMRKLSNREELIECIEQTLEIPAHITCEAISKLRGLGK